MLPADATRTAINERVKDGLIDLEDLEDVARQFDVSLEALFWRIHWLYRRDVEVTKQDIARSKLEASHRSPNEYPKPPRYPERYSALAIRALKRGEVSLGRFAQYLGLSRTAAERYLPRGPEEDEEIQIAVP